MENEGTPLEKSLAMLRQPRIALPVFGGLFLLLFFIVNTDSDAKLDFILWESKVSTLFIVIVSFLLGIAADRFLIPAIKKLYSRGEE